MLVGAANAVLDQPVVFEIYSDFSVIEANRIGVFDLSTIRVLIRCVLYYTILYTHIIIRFMCIIMVYII